MPSSLTAAGMKDVLARLGAANDAFARVYPGEGAERLPVHTVYGGAHLFRHDSCRKLGELALGSLLEYAPDFAVFARAVGLKGHQGLPETAGEARALGDALARNTEGVRKSNHAAWMAHTAYSRVVEKLTREPVEDFRIDFEDGYGTRADSEEDSCAEQAAAEVARGMKEGTLPPFIGIRVKTFSREMHPRGIRTLDIFLTTLAGLTGGKLPANFVVTLPKVVAPEHVTALVDVFELIEKSTGIAAGALKLEVMVETTQSIIDAQGRTMLPRLVEAGRGRCIGAHFGVYDYTASCNITAEHQSLVHPACDFARDVMQVALTGMGLMLSDGATNIMPVAPHRAGVGAGAGAALTVQQVAENRASVHRAWRLHFEHIQHSLTRAYYQGWDLNPAQLPTRYAAVYSFFLEAFEPAAVRLKNFVEKAARATLAGDVFDDAATAQGLLTFFLQGLARGALTEEDLRQTGVTAAEMRLRSFGKILEARSGRR